MTHTHTHTRTQDVLTHTHIIKRIKMRSELKGYLGSITKDISTYNRYIYMSILHTKFKQAQHGTDSCSPSWIRKSSFFLNLALFFCGMFFRKSGEEEEKRPDEEEEDEEDEGAFFPSAPVMSRHIGTAVAGDRPEAAPAGAAARTGLGTYGFILSLQNFLTSDRFKKKSSPSFSMPLAIF